LVFTTVSLEGFLVSNGVKREIANNMAVSVDYVGNRGRDNTAVIDINEGPINPATGRVTRLGVNVFDPTGALVPLSNTAARKRGSDMTRPVVRSGDYASGGFYMRKPN